MKKILGLDIGTNSIGGALINLPDSFEDYGKEGNIEWLGSRIIPVDGDYLQKFESGAQATTKAASRRVKRGSRRLKQRYKLRRTRLTKVFKIIGWLDEDFPENFKKKMKDDENFKFSINDYLPFTKETIDEATRELGVVNKHDKLALPEDWVIYYLRKKAITEKISFQELARIIYMMNQRRGFKSSRKDLKDDNVVEIKKVFELTIKSIEENIEKGEKQGKKTYIITSDNAEIGSWEKVFFKKPDWIDKKFTYVVTWKNGKRNMPEKVSADDWEPAMVALDNLMEERGEHPGTFFFNKIKEDKNYKIRQFPVRREKYKKELETIWKKQLELNDELKKINLDKCCYQHVKDTK